MGTFNTVLAIELIRDFDTLHGELRQVASIPGLDPAVAGLFAAMGQLAAMRDGTEAEAAGFAPKSGRADKFFDRARFWAVVLFSPLSFWGSSLYIFMTMRFFRKFRPRLVKTVAPLPNSRNTA